MSRRIISNKSLKFLNVTINSHNISVCFIFRKKRKNGRIESIGKITLWHSLRWIEDGETLTGKHLWQSLFLTKLEASTSTYNFIKKETLAQVFPCEFCEIFKNILFTEYLWATASEDNGSNSNSRYSTSVSRNLATVCIAPDKFQL